MDLKETILMMNSIDYKERFKAEYYQLNIRYMKLLDMYNNWNTLGFTPTCPKGLYHEQLYHMSNYLGILRQRAELEGIEL